MSKTFAPNGYPGPSTAKGNIPQMRKAGPGPGPYGREDPAPISQAIQRKILKKHEKAVGEKRLSSADCEPHIP